MAYSSSIALPVSVWLRIREGEMMDGGSKRGFYGLAIYPIDGVSSRRGIGSSLGKAMRI